MGRGRTNNELEWPIYGHNNEWGGGGQTMSLDGLFEDIIMNGEGRR